MTTTIYTDRSRIETMQHCERERWLRYHEGPRGLGITSVAKPLPLAVGGAVHAGLAHLLTACSDPQNQSGADAIEVEAVAAALADFAQYAGRLELATDEQAAMTLPDDPDLRRQMEGGKTAYDDYLYHEQAALIEGLVRAYARRRLRPLLEEYEVLEVEREGTWQLVNVPHFVHHETGGPFGRGYMEDGPNGYEIVFMSRPDALLLNRRSRSLELLSYKTAASWDVRKARDAEHDMQGLSEAIEVEQRLGEWWRVIHDCSGEVISKAGLRMTEFLAHSAAPPRILAVRYEYILKGERRKDKDASARFGFTVRTQSSPLTRAHLNAGMTAGDEQWNWSYDYIKEDGSPSKLYAKNWPGKAVWEHMSTRAWIDMLDATHMAVGEEGREMGWQGAAQASGFTTEHPLDSLFLPPIAVHRNDDDLRDLVDQMGAQETRVAEGVAAVRAATDEGERRHLLNVHFQQTRRACEYPSTCSFVKLCYGGEDIRRDPLATGLFVVREPHHTPETEAARVATAKAK